jgi:hypothetical protein
MEQRMYDLKFKQLAGDTIRLTQTDCGEDYVIDAHPEQIKFVARQLCGMTADTAATVQELERRISVLADRLEELVTAAWLREQIVERCVDGVEILCRFDGLLDLATEFDGGRLLPSYAKNAQESPTANKCDAGKADAPPHQLELA